jgi:CCR4-NOT transcription complex subunit 1
LATLQVVEMLKRFKASANPRENLIFNCMIHNLFDEYRFFPKYPDKELHITAVRDGALLLVQINARPPLPLPLSYLLFSPCFWSMVPVWMASTGASRVHAPA